MKEKFSKMKKIEIINYIVAIKRTYQPFLSPFFDTKETLKYRNYIYSLPFTENICDFFWEYLNDDISYFDLIRIANIIKVI